MANILLGRKKMLTIEEKETYQDFKEKHYNKVYFEIVNLSKTMSKNQLGRWLDDLIIAINDKTFYGKEAGENDPKFDLKLQAEIILYLKRRRP